MKCQGRLGCPCELCAAAAAELTARPSLAAPPRTMRSPVTAGGSSFRPTYTPSLPLASPTTFDAAAGDSAAGDDDAPQQQPPPRALVLASPPPAQAPPPSFSAQAAETLHVDIDTEDAAFGDAAADAAFASRPQVLLSPPVPAVAAAAAAAAAASNSSGSSCSSGGSGGGRYQSLALRQRMAREAAVAAAANPAQSLTALPTPEPATEAPPQPTVAAPAADESPLPTPPSVLTTAATINGGAESSLPSAADDRPIGGGRASGFRSRGSYELPSPTDSAGGGAPGGDGSETPASAAASAAAYAAMTLPTRLASKDGKARRHGYGELLAAVTVASDASSAPPLTDDQAAALGPALFKKALSDSQPACVDAGVALLAAVLARPAVAASALPPSASPAGDLLPVLVTKVFGSLKHADAGADAAAALLAAEAAAAAPSTAAAGLPALLKSLTDGLRPGPTRKPRHVASCARALSGLCVAVAAAAPPSRAKALASALSAAVDDGGVLASALPSLLSSSDKDLRRAGAVLTGGLRLVRRDDVDDALAALRASKSGLPSETDDAVAAAVADAAAAAAAKRAAVGGSTSAAAASADSGATNADASSSSPASAAERAAATEDRRYEAAVPMDVTREWEKAVGADFTARLADKKWSERAGALDAAAALVTKHARLAPDCDAVADVLLPELRKVLAGDANAAVTAKALGLYEALAARTRARAGPSARDALDAVVERLREKRGPVLTASGSLLVAWVRYGCLEPDALLAAVVRAYLTAGASKTTAPEARKNALTLLAALVASRPALPDAALVGTGEAAATAAPTQRGRATAPPSVTPLGAPTPFLSSLWDGVLAGCVDPAAEVRLEAARAGAAVLARLGGPSDPPPAYAPAVGKLLPRLEAAGIAAYERMLKAAAAAADGGAAASDAAPTAVAARSASAGPAPRSTTAAPASSSLAPSSGSAAPPLSSGSTGAGRSASTGPGSVAASTTTPATGRPPVGRPATGRPPTAASTARAGTAAAAPAQPSAAASAASAASDAAFLASIAPEPGAGPDIDELLQRIRDGGLPGFSGEQLDAAASDKWQDRKAAFEALGAAVAGVTPPSARPGWFEAAVAVLRWATKEWKAQSNVMASAAAAGAVETAAAAVGDDPAAGTLTRRAVAAALTGLLPLLKDSKVGPRVVAAALAAARATAGGAGPGLLLHSLTEAVTSPKAAPTLCKHAAQAAAALVARHGYGRLPLKPLLALLLGDGGLGNADVGVRKEANVALNTLWRQMGPPLVAVLKAASSGNAPGLPVLPERTLAVVTASFDALGYDASVARAELEATAPLAGETAPPALLLPGEEGGGDADGGGAPSSGVGSPSILDSLLGPREPVALETRLPPSVLADLNPATGPAGASGGGKSSGAAAPAAASDGGGGPERRPFQVLDAALSALIDALGALEADGDALALTPLVADALPAWLARWLDAPPHANTAGRAAAAVDALARAAGNDWVGGRGPRLVAPLLRHASSSAALVRGPVLAALETLMCDHSGQWAYAEGGGDGAGAATNASRAAAVASAAAAGKGAAAAAAAPGTAPAPPKPLPTHSDHYVGVLAACLPALSGRGGDGSSGGAASSAAGKGAALREAVLPLLAKRAGHVHRCATSMGPFAELARPVMLALVGDRSPAVKRACTELLTHVVRLGTLSSLKSSVARLDGLAQSDVKALLDALTAADAVSKRHTVPVLVPAASGRARVVAAVATGVSPRPTATAAPVAAPAAPAPDAFAPAPHAAPVAPYQPKARLRQSTATVASSSSGVTTASTTGTGGLPRVRPPPPPAAGGPSRAGTPAGSPAASEASFVSADGGDEPRAALPPSTASKATAPAVLPADATGVAARAARLREATSPGALPPFVLCVACDRLPPGGQGAEVSRKRLLHDWAVAGPGASAGLLAALASTATPEARAAGARWLRYTDWARLLGGGSSAPSAAPHADLLLRSAALLMAPPAGQAGPGPAQHSHRETAVDAAHGAAAILAALPAVTVLEAACLHSLAERAGAAAAASSDRHDLLTALQAALVAAVGKADGAAAASAAVASATPVMLAGSTPQKARVDAGIATAVAAALESMSPSRAAALGAGPLPPDALLTLLSAGCADARLDRAGVRGPLYAPAKAVAGWAFTAHGVDGAHATADEVAGLLFAGAGKRSVGAAAGGKAGVAGAVTEELRQLLRTWLAEWTRTGGTTGGGGSLLRAPAVPRASVSSRRTTGGLPRSPVASQQAPVSRARSGSAHSDDSMPSVEELADQLVVVTGSSSSTAGGHTPSPSRLPRGPTAAGAASARRPGASLRSSHELPEQPDWMAPSAGPLVRPSHDLPQSPAPFYPRGAAATAAVAAKQSSPPSDAENTAPQAHPSVATGGTASAAAAAASMKRSQLLVPSPQRARAVREALARSQSLGGAAAAASQTVLAPEWPADVEAAAVAALSSSSTTRAPLFAPAALLALSSADQAAAVFSAAVEVLSASPAAAAAVEPAADGASTPTVPRPVRFAGTAQLTALAALASAAARGNADILDYAADAATRAVTGLPGELKRHVCVGGSVPPGVWAWAAPLVLRPLLAALHLTATAPSVAAAAPDLAPAVLASLAALLARPGAPVGAVAAEEVLAGAHAFLLSAASSTGVGFVVSEPATVAAAAALADAARKQLPLTAVARVAVRTAADAAVAGAYPVRAAAVADAAATRPLLVALPALADAVGAGGRGWTADVLVELLTAAQAAFVSSGEPALAEAWAAASSPDSRLPAVSGASPAGAAAADLCEVLRAAARSTSGCVALVNVTGVVAESGAVPRGSPLHRYAVGLATAALRANSSAAPAASTEQLLPLDAALAALDAAFATLSAADAVGASRDAADAAARRIPAAAYAHFKHCASPSSALSPAVSAAEQTRLADRAAELLQTLAATAPGAASRVVAATAAFFAARTDMGGMAFYARYVSEFKPTYGLGGLLAPPPAVVATTTASAAAGGLPRPATAPGGGSAKPPTPPNALGAASRTGALQTHAQQGGAAAVSRRLSAGVGPASGSSSSAGSGALSSSLRRCGSSSSSSSVCSSPSATAARRASASNGAGGAGLDSPSAPGAVRRMSADGGSKPVSAPAAL